ncbi:MAG: hypothetical protein JWM31_336 [Solirubrobacterales bacterium]|nr:hypothetical protein [Solirubrobacterales bacterium]
MSTDASSPAAGPAVPGAVTPDEPFALERTGLDGLADRIQELGGRPIDTWAIAALLESIGIRDRDARERFDLQDVFALAAAVQAHLPPPSAATPVGEPDVLPFRTQARRVARLSGRGAFFIVPLGLQLLALLTLGVSQFAAVDFTRRQASIVAIAAALGFMASSGFGQGLGYLVPLFEMPGKHNITQRLVWRMLAGGTLGVVSTAGVLWGVCASTGAYGGRDTRIALGYFVLVSLQALPQAVLYLRRRYDVMLAGTVAGLAAVSELHHATTLPIYAEHWIGLSVTLLVELVGITILLRASARTTAGAMRLATLPHSRMLARRALPYALYGLVYFVFLTSDRLVAWAAGSHPLPFWFSTQYELGLDWALGAIVLALAFLEVSIDGFSGLLHPLSERFGVSGIEQHNAALSRFWRRQLALSGGLMLFGGAAAVGVEQLLAHLGGLGPATALASQHATRWTFAGGVAGYALLAVGMTNAVFLLSLARPGPIVKAMTLAAALSVAIGISLTTWLPYYTAVLGLVAGAFVFAVLTASTVRRTLRSGAYWSYAAW